MVTSAFLRLGAFSYEVQGFAVCFQLVDAQLEPLDVLLVQRHREIGADGFLLGQLRGLQHFLDMLQALLHVVQLVGQELLLAEHDAVNRPHVFQHDLGVAGFL